MKRDMCDIEQITADFYAPIYEYICRKIDDRHAAYDLTQNVFLAFYETDLHTTIEDARAWLYSTARRQAAQYHRQNYRKRAHETADAADDTQMTVDGDLADSFTDGDIAQMKAGILEALTDEERALYRAVYEEDVDYQRLSDTYGITYDALRKRISRIRKKIRLAIQKLLYCLFWMIYRF